MQGARIIASVAQRVNPRRENARIAATFFVQRRAHARAHGEASMDTNEHGRATGRGAAMDLRGSLARAQPAIFGPPCEHAVSIELRLARAVQGTGSGTGAGVVYGAGVSAGSGTGVGAGIGAGIRTGSGADTGAGTGAEASADVSVARLRAALEALALDGSAGNAGVVPIVGLGTALARHLGVAPAGLHELGHIGTPPRGFVPTPQDLWLLVPAASPSQAFDASQALIAQLAPLLVVSESVALFRHRDGRDLTGFRDGTENPQGEAAYETALLRAPPHAGGTFALVQRFVHRHADFAALPVGHQSLVIGRERESDEEIETAPLSAHVKRTAQEDFAPEAFMWRRSMPWGTPSRHGLQFIAFMADLGRADRMLGRMAGLDDGITDALLDYTTAETSAYYYCPPLRAGRLDLAAG
jgi:putative iron-dependent peroxidase